MKRCLVIFFLFLVVLLNSSYSDILPEGVEWIVRSDGNDDIIYNGGIPDDLAYYTLDGVRHDSLQYRYNHSRRGVLVNVGKVYWSSTETLGYGSLTDDTSPNFPDDQLYVMFIPGENEGLDVSQYPERCFSQGYYIPWSNLWGEIKKQDKEFELTHMYYDGNWHGLPIGGYYLFRYLHLPRELESWSDGVIGQETEKLVIVVHGWNSSGVSYQQDSYFVNLANSIQSKISNSDWKLIAYDWKLDANTGGKISTTAKNIEDKNAAPTQFWPIENAVEAAETAHMHGQNLGQLILEKCPNIKQVHIIAHSAGTWCARTAIKHLIDNTGDDFKAQITLLDPFMPLECGGESLLCKQIIEQLPESENNWKFELLENYYSEDTFILGTNELFAWGNFGFNALLSRSSLGTVYDGHEGPIEFYIDSVNNSTVYDLDWGNYSVLVDHPHIGWNSKMFAWKLSMPWFDSILPKRCNIDNEGSVNLSDYSRLSMYWNINGCSNENNWCDNVDINMSGAVDFNDFKVFISHWLDD